MDRIDSRTRPGETDLDIIENLVDRLNVCAIVRESVDGRCAATVDVVW